MKSVFIRNIVILVAVFLIVYALADGINQYNALSIFLALGGFAALCVGIYLYSQLQQADEEEEQLE
jgi:membrane associated rhomboid family serine protease